MAKNRKLSAKPKSDYEKLEEAERIKRRAVSKKENTRSKIKKIVGRRVYFPVPPKREVKKRKGDFRGKQIVKGYWVSSYKRRKSK